MLIYWSREDILMTHKNYALARIIANLVRIKTVPTRLNLSLAICRNLKSEHSGRVFSCVRYAQVSKILTKWIIFHVCNILYQHKMQAKQKASSHMKQLLKLLQINIGETYIGVILLAISL